MKPYAQYKPSGVKWLGDLPSHWEVRRVKEVSTVNPSNIDKLTVDGQTSVKLCNYVDVYKNEKIKSGIDFMEATATSEQIDKFSLKVGDVVVTKDSESPWDIAVPTVIDEEIPNLVCGYHLAMLTPYSIDGRFLAWAFRAYQVNLHFALNSCGITRYGLGASALGAGNIPFPSPNEQESISNFLDNETKRIDKLIVEKDELIKLLEEFRKSTVTMAVTRGVNPNVELVPSGIPELGDVPIHWVVGKVKRFFTSLDGKRIPLSGEERTDKGGEYPYYGASGIIDYLNDYIFDEDLILVSEDGANLLSRVTPISFVAKGKYWVNNHAHVIRPIDENLVFWSERIEALDLSPFITGSAQPKLTSDALNRLIISCPPSEEERKAIQDYILVETSRIDALITHTQDEIALLKELRAATIADAVLGRIDVRTQSHH